MIRTGFRRASETALAIVLAGSQILPVSAESTAYKTYTYHFCPHEITDTDYTDEMAYR